MVLVNYCIFIHLDYLPHEKFGRKGTEVFEEEKEDCRHCFGIAYNVGPVQSEIITVTFPYVTVKRFLDNC